MTGMVPAFLLCRILFRHSKTAGCIPASGGFVL